MLSSTTTTTTTTTRPVSELIKDYCQSILLEHPKASLITDIALIALSLASYNQPSLSTLFKFSAGSAALLGTGLAYEWSHIFRQVWHGLLNRPYEPTFKPTFKEDTFLGDKQEVLATMKYSNKLPILTFSEAVTDPAQRGYIQGYMLADQIVDMGLKALRPMLAFLRWEKGENGDAKIKETIDRLDIPDEVRNELLGVIKGVEEACEAKGKKCPKEATAFIFAAHVITDHYKAIGSSLGCSAVVYRDKPGEPPVVGRNLDWVSMGYLGRHLFLRRYEVATSTGSRQVSSFTFPGYVGVLTAWNSDGLIVLVNELGKTAKEKGKPYSLMTKELIEKCSTVDEAVTWLSEQQQQSPCASSVSLVIVDAKQAKIYHYYPEGNDQIIIKDLSDQGILTVTNHAHDEQGNLLPNSICESKSIDRLNRLQTALISAKNEGKTSIEVVEAALKAAGVAATMGVFIADLSSEKKKLLLDDFFAHKQIDKQPYLTGVGIVDEVDRVD
jgi:hypothetical protein